jgi:hypothetical protein
LEAEAIRDNALAASGLLSRKVGGPSVYPHQPEGVWNNPYSGERWATSQGEDLYRRGIYTFWKRTAPYPTFMAFDATSREACTAMRTRTNTPLQSLTLMNDPAFLEAAKGLARRMLKADRPEERVTLGFRLCTGRRPTKPEEAALLKLVHGVRTRYEASPEDARKFGGDVETATWTLVASTLLNLDETITKG